MTAKYSLKAKLTAKLIDKTAPDSACNVFLWDTESDRLGLRITPNGHRSFVFQYTRRGRDRRMTLGQYGKELTLDQARKLARKLRLEVLNGGDPAEEKGGVEAGTYSGGPCGSIHGRTRDRTQGCNGSLVSPVLGSPYRSRHWIETRC